MAKDKLFLAKAGTLNQNGVPAWALYVQLIWSSVLCLSGTYGALLDYTIFAALLFYVLTVAGIYRLRKSQPDAERPYKAFGYPILPAIYMICASAIALVLLIYKSENTLPGLLVVLLGIPVYYFTQKSAKK
jgi:APA family basic amino acid/polyamine antiporter